MAIRYSGDAEVRLQWDDERRLYRGVVSDPEFVWRGTTGPTGLSPRSSEAYDRAARVLLKRADTWAQENEDAKIDYAEDQSGMVILRVFQAPCPTRTLGTDGRRSGGRRATNKARRRAATK